MVARQASEGSTFPEIDDDVAVVNEEEYAGWKEEYRLEAGSV